MKIWISALLLFAISGRLIAATPSAVSLVEGMEQTLWSDSNHGRHVMRIESEYWTRELQLEAWMDRPDHTLIRIHSPKKEAGVGSLRIGDAMWNYLPKVDRTIKIPPSMMLQPWMGSNFSNDDLVKESSFVDDYTHELAGVDDSGEVTVYRVATVARKLLNSLETPFQFEGTDLRVSIGTSIGIAMYPEDGAGAETLVERADMAIYAVKQRKKTTFIFTAKHDGRQKTGRHVALNPSSKPLGLPQ
ncbi:MULTISPECIES: outer membrane lipoprotein-sorting protein [Marinobacter]|uniref:outer membrane lipoprotein-sorting protein n=1 Tax=Marinobacter TaxID=2742 RepID=UPI001244EDB5|nr:MULTISPECIES: outer membrane lipoprotein-sorting protein [Marinobacter]MBL3559054.1 outer membrane lipoprotein-sorting protein [Marinobacter sp. JB05H06]